MGEWVGGWVYLVEDVEVEGGEEGGDEGLEVLHGEGRGLRVEVLGAPHFFLEDVESG